MAIAGGFLIKKNLLILSVCLVAVFLCVGVVAAADTESNETRKKTVSSSATVKNGEGSSSLIDKGTYKWTDSGGHSCYYTWKTYKYSNHYVTTNYSYKHQGNAYTGAISFKNLKNHNIYTQFSGNMWVKQYKYYLNTYIDASKYADIKLKEVNRKGSLIRYFKHPAGVYLDDRIDWKIDKVIVEKPYHWTKDQGDYLKVTCTVTKNIRAGFKYPKSLYTADIHLYLVNTKNVPDLTIYRKYPNEPNPKYPQMNEISQYGGWDNSGISGSGTAKARQISVPCLYGKCGKLTSGDYPPSGYYMIAAVIDARGDWDEWDENNNVTFSELFYYKAPTKQ